MSQEKGVILLYVYWLIPSLSVHPQAFSSASQGLLNSLVYGWTQSTFRSASKASLRDVDTQTPLLQSQKKGYQTGPRTMG